MREDLDALPRWVPPVVFAMLTLVAFRTYLLADSGMMLLGQDTIAAGIMFRRFFVEQYHALGRLPLWNPYLYGGVPTIEAGSGDILYPTSVLHFVLPLIQALAWKLILHVFLAGGFMYLAARAFGASRLVSLFAGVAYQLAPNLVSLTWGGQDGKMYVITLFPAALWLLVTGIERVSWVRFVWLGVVAGLMLIAHPQLAYYAYLTLAAYALGSLWARRKEARSTAIRLAGGALAAALALGVAAIVLLPMYRYLREYSPRAGEGRGLEYAASYSLHAEETASLFIPEFSGTEVQSDTYWGKNPLKHNSEYGGAVVLLLGIGAVIGLRGDRRRWGLTAIAVVALLYSLGTGTPFFRLVYALIPGVRNFRAPSLAMFLFVSSVTLLAALGLERATSGADERTRRTLSRALLVGGIIALGWGILAQVAGESLLRAWTGIFGASPFGRDAAMLANIPRMALGGFLIALWCGLGWGAMRGYERGQVSARTLVIMLGVITAVDLLRVDARFIQVVRYSDYFADDPGITALRQRLAPGERILDFPGTFPTPGFLATYQIPEVFGYHGNQLRWYDELTRRNAREGAQTAEQAQRYWLDFLGSPVLRALAARYAILQGRPALPGYEVVGGNDQIAILRNTQALPGAAVVPGIRVEPDSARQIELLWSPQLDPSKEVVVFAAPAGLEKGGGTGSARFESEGADTLVLRATNNGPAMLLVSRTYHPSWVASVDGAEVPVSRTDYGLIGVPLTQAGDHLVTLRYRPAIVATAKRISVLAWLVVLLASLGSIVVSRRRNASAAAA